MSVNEAYFVMEGIAYMHGFDEMINRDRFISLYLGLMATKGIAYMQGRGWVNFFLRLLRAEAEGEDHRPTCCPECVWRQRYTGFARQRNALRIELASMVEPWRCGWDIKPGCIGGHPLDYEPCVMPPAL